MCSARRGGRRCAVASLSDNASWTSAPSRACGGQVAETDRAACGLANVLSRKRRSISPVAEPPPVVALGAVAEPPMAVNPLQLDLAPAERHLRKRIRRSDERPGLLRISRRSGHARVIVVRRVARPGV